MSDNGNHLIRKVTKEGKVSTIIGIPQIYSVIYFPNGMCIDKNDCVYFCDSGLRVIRKYDTKINHLSIIAGMRDKQLEHEEDRTYGKALETKFR